MGRHKGVGKKETQKGLLQINSFVEKHSEANIIVMSLPHRYDLEVNSCVNNDVKVLIENYENI